MAAVVVVVAVVQIVQPPVDAMLTLSSSNDGNHLDFFHNGYTSFIIIIGPHILWLSSGNHL